MAFYYLCVSIKRTLKWIVDMNFKWDGSLFRQVLLLLHINLLFSAFKETFCCLFQRRFYK